MVAKLITEPGFIGAFTRTQVEGLAPNGSRMRKIHSAFGDTHRDGALCTVLGSISNLDAPTAGYARAGYFVAWDDQPYIAVFITEDRLAIADN